MLEYRTQGFQGYAVKYSPFFDNRIAVAASANYGLVGNGRLYILELTPHGIQPLKRYFTVNHGTWHMLTSQLSNSRRSIRCHPL